MDQLTVLRSAPSPHVAMAIVPHPKRMAAASKIVSVLVTLSNAVTTAARELLPVPQVRVVVPRAAPSSLGILRMGYRTAVPAVTTALSASCVSMAPAPIRSSYFVLKIGLDVGQKASIAVPSKSSPIRVGAELPR